MPLPITQKAIAAAAGLSPATVCLALKNCPRIAPGTRAKVHAVAARLGYRRDPMMAALAAYRLTRRPRAFHGVLAWLTSSAEGLDWRIVPEFCEYHESAARRAAELGYKLELFDLHAYRGDGRRLARVFRNRGIRGALVCPMPQAHFRLDVPLEELAVLVIGYTIEQPSLHRVMSHHYANMLDLLAQLRARGYRRIGYAVPAEHNERLAGLYLAAFLQWQHQAKDGDRVPTLEADHASALQPWLRAHQPHAVITSRHCFATWPARLKAQVPRRFGVAVVSVLDARSALAGINECSREIGRAGAQVVAGMVERGETGIPALPHCLLIRSAWHEGGSLRAAPTRQDNVAVSDATAAVNGAAFVNAAAPRTRRGQAS